MAPRRIAIIGAECTGKTTLAQALAARLPAIWVPEHLRDFCETHGRTPRAEEQRDLIRRQVELEREALARAAREAVDWVICDSTPLATALYSAQLFGDETLLDAALAHQQGYAVTLLAEIDLPWQPDGIQRDGPVARTDFHDRLIRLLASARLPHHRISGDAKTRLATARSAVLGSRRI